MPMWFAGLGTESVIDETLYVLRSKLNDAIAFQQEAFVAADQRRSTMLAIPYVPIVIEPIPLSNFHAGSLPSFVASEDRESEYPMCAVVPGRTVPDGEDASADQYDVLNNVVVIHVFARARMTDEEGYNLAYRRVERMGAAVHQLVKTDPKLRSMFAGLSGPTLVERSEPWRFPAGDGHGDDWVWNALMQQYQVKNYSHTPTEV